ncbi:flagellar basal-body rod modification protein FlgD [Rhodovulum imhoffii]|uniref:Basal-body rod modification protein FlgD n=1 Tax=Rhodovulum imhoffii TaxID=365340 RepID=A0A2T5BRR8_9RHOB|nr:flagellar hook capping FlgD N-terminal domain-containing protein [Rhodovulum imhoffii]MBK5932496.1 hypothetical protein [Rhodovulum imhoffii]PTN01980.1 flagellar basal-body rod modification protein FlgD [Rhodovulum imhoffii]
MEISNAAAQTAPSRKTGPANGLSSDFETFLRMLTTQMQNQNPLNPMQSSEFAVQLATFSGVEQQVRTNELLSAMADTLNGGITRYGAWIGMEALSPAAAQVSGGAVTVETLTAKGAEAAMLVITDAQGSEIRRIEIDPQGGPVTWDGTDESGLPVEEGVYGFTVESLAGKEVIGTTPALTYNRIVELRQDRGQTVVLLENGQAVFAEDVRGLRSP